MKVRLILAMAALLAAGVGCVERKLTITSEPPGAIVTISDVEVGRTPVTIPFTWYADYEIILRREGGYETLKTHADLKAPAYEVAPIDLFSELAPWTYKDHRYLHYSLTKATEPTDQELIDRAKTFRVLTNTTMPATQEAKKK
jgi:hypothetical protein